MVLTRPMSKAAFVAQGGDPVTTISRGDVLPTSLILDIFEDSVAWEKIHAHTLRPNLRRKFVAKICGSDNNYYRAQTPVRGLGVHRARVDFYFLCSLTLNRTRSLTGASQAQKDWLMIP